MNTLQKKWLIILQGLLFASSGIAILTNGFQVIIISLLLVLSSLSGTLFLELNTKVTAIKIYKSMLTIEVIMTLLSVAVFIFIGDSTRDVILIFGLFSLFFGMIPFLFLFGVLTSGFTLNFSMTKFRLISGVISGVFGFYLIAVKHRDPAETLKYIGIAIIIIGVCMIYGFRLVQKIVTEHTIRKV